MNKPSERFPAGALPETVYTPRGGSRNPIKVLPAIARELRQSLSLGYRLASRNIKAKYRKSFLGMFWAIFPPLINAAIWIILQSQQVIQFEGLNAPYPVFVLSGILLWGMFQQSINVVLNSVKQHKSLLTKINFPREALLFGGVMQMLFTTMLSMIVLVFAMIYFKVNLTSMLLLALPGMLTLILFGLGLGMVLMPLSMLYDDVQKAIPMVLRFGFFMTPVIYPEPKFTGLAALLNLNPVTPLLTSTRAWLLGTPQEANVTGFLMVAGLILALCVAGLVIYRLSMNIIIERIGS